MLADQKDANDAADRAQDPTARWLLGRQGMPRRRQLRVSHVSAVAILMVVATLTRLWVVVLAHPAVGFGNNFDFIRQSSCVGLWEDYGNLPKFYPHLDGPVTRLVFDGDRQKTLCLASVDNLFPYLAAHTHRKHDHVDLREVGVWKALLASAFLIVFAMHTIPQSVKLPLLGTVALAVGDLDALSYANTLYLEFSVLLAGIAALGACAINMARKTAPGWRDMWLAVAAVAWLGATKQQYGGLAVGLAALTAGNLFLRWRYQACAKAGVLLAAAIGAMILFNALNVSREGLLVADDYANRTDTFLGAVLPAARDRDRALRLMGLPASCRAAVGQTWYTIGANKPHPCSQVLHLSRWRLLPLFAAQPTTLTIPLAHAVTLIQQPATNEATRWESEADSRRLLYRIFDYTSPAYLIEMLSLGAYKVIVSSTAVVGVGALALFARHVASCSPARSHGLAMAALGEFTLLYTIVSSVFGDGYQDIHRHAVMLPAATLFIISGCICWVWERGITKES